MIGCFGAFLGAFFCALTAAIGGKGNAEGALPGTLAPGGAVKGGTNGAGLRACTGDVNGPLPIGGIVEVGGGAIGADLEACSFEAGTAGTVDCGIDAGEALWAAAAARGFKLDSMFAMVQRRRASGSSA